jgi:hypothetical protein
MTLPAIVDPVMNAKLVVTSAAFVTADIGGRGGGSALLGGGPGGAIFGGSPLAIPLTPY